MAKLRKKKKINLEEEKITLVKSRVSDQRATYITKVSSSQSNLSLGVLKQDGSSDLMDIKEAAKWASEYMGKNVTASNISYLIQYGRIRKFGNNGTTQISKKELTAYYSSFNGHRELSWKDQLGKDLNWALSFEQYKEAETTKHVHRLHPYKGKFIPQLVEYFLDDHTDIFKKEVYFHKGDIILDPFCGNGTTLVQANELGMHAIGIDVSTFNALINN